MARTTEQSPSELSSIGIEVGTDVNNWFRIELPRKNWHTL